MAAITHPDYASLVAPLFAARKGGCSKIFFPLYAVGEERVVERSKDRVSKLADCKINI
jgi:hypothetical protein